MFDIGEQSITDILRERERYLMACLAGNPDEAVVPVDIFERQMSNIATTQRQSGQQQNDGAVLHAYWPCLIK